MRDEKYTRKEITRQGNVVREVKREGGAQGGITSWSCLLRRGRVCRQHDRVISTGEIEKYKVAACRVLSTVLMSRRDTSYLTGKTLRRGSAG